MTIHASVPYSTLEIDSRLIFIDVSDATAAHWLPG